MDLDVLERYATSIKVLQAEETLIAFEVAAFPYQSKKSDMDDILQRWRRQAIPPRDEKREQQGIEALVESLRQQGF